MSVDTGPHHSAFKWPVWTNQYSLAQADTGFSGRPEHNRIWYG